MIKRMLAALTAALLSIGVVFVSGVFAEGMASEPVVFQIGSVMDAVPGDTVSVPLFISSDSGYTAHCLRLGINYDPEMLSVVSVTPGEVWNGLPMDSMRMCNYKNPGEVAVSLLCPTDGMEGTGLFLSVNFVISEECREPLQINVEVYEFFYSPVDGIGAEDIPFAAEPGVIEIDLGPASVPGDANEDGEVSILDISWISLLLTGAAELSEQGMINADFNCDGQVTYLDISDLYIFLLSA